MNVAHLSIYRRLQPVVHLCLLTLLIVCAGWSGMGGIAVAAAQAPASQVNHMVSDLLMHLPLDEVAGERNFMDLSGNGNHGVGPTDAWPTSAQPGRFYNAVAFDGVNEKIQVANNPSLEFGSAQDFTVLLWVKFDSSPRAWDALISSKQWWGGTTSGFILSVDSSGNKWTVNAADGTHRTDAYANGPNISDNQWHYLAATFDRDGQMVMYQDGIPVGNASMSGVGNISNSFPLFIGNTYSGDEPYAGLLDEVMIYNRVLTPEEIAMLGQGDCTVSNGGDSGENTLRDDLADSACRTIYFASDFTITLAQPLTNIRSVTVDGSGRNIVISGNNNARVLATSGAQVTLIHLTFRDGQPNDCESVEEHAGAGIYHHGLSSGGSETLTLVDSTVANNYNDGCFGGGIFNDGGVVNLINSTVSGNSAVWGGGVYDFGGRTNIINSTLANNASTLGGGVFTTDSTIMIDNSTLVNNRADWSEGAGGGGIYSRNEEDVIVIRNSLIASSLAGGNCAGEAFEPSTANNLADDETCGSGFNASSRLLLGALGNYGGSTATIPLLPGSAAIDAGDPAVCAASGGVNHLDQRGRVRPDTSCDIGAFESQGFSLAITGGSPQSAAINAAFAQPLTVEVAANAPDEPVNGGRVVFAGPSSGASTNPVTSTVTIASAAASLVATANGVVGGPYQVAAGAAGAASVNFSLTNAKGTAIVTLGSLAHTYDGAPKSATVTTDPAGLGFSITYDGSAAPPTSAGEFAVLAVVEDLNYQGSVTGTLVIARAPLTVTGIVAADRVYDGGLAATLNTAGASLSGVLSGDDVTLDASGATGAFADKHVGVDKPVTISGLALNGAQAGNYLLNPTLALADITARPLTVTGIIAADKVYDGGRAAAFDTAGASLSGVMSGDAVALDASGATGAFADKHVGVDKPVTISGLALSGADAGNYTLSPTAAALADITARPLTAAADQKSKVYGTSDPALTYQVTAGSLAAGDGLSGELSRLAGENAGVYAINQGTLTAGSNYTLTFVSANLTITPAPASLLLGSLNQVYDGTPRPITVTTNPAGLSGVSVLYAGSPAAPVQAGFYTVTVSLSNLNYQAGVVTGVLVIAKASASAVLQLSANSISVGQVVTLTLTLSPAASVVGLPTGEITFMDGSAVIGVAQLVNTGGSLQATLSLSNLPAGDHPLSARYTGDGNFLPGASNIVVLTVTTVAPSYAIYFPVLSK